MSDVVFSTSDIIFPASDIVFPTSSVVLGVLGKTASKLENNAVFRLFVNFWGLAAHCVCEQ